MSDPQPEPQPSRLGWLDTAPGHMIVCGAAIMAEMIIYLALHFLNPMEDLRAAAMKSAGALETIAILTLTRALAKASDGQ